MTLTVNEAPETQKNNQQLQLRTLVKQPLKSGTEYRISFRCRAERPAVISFRVQESVQPWKSPTEKAAGSVRLRTQWTQVEYCFTAAADTAGKAVWMPNFELSRLGSGNVFFISDLKIEALD